MLTFGNVHRFGVNRDASNVLVFRHLGGDLQGSGFHAPVHAKDLDLPSIVAFAYEKCKASAQKQRHVD